MPNTYSHSQIDTIVKYVLNQEVHHQKKSFRQEYHELLDGFEIKYEERFMFEFME